MEQAAACWSHCVKSAGWGADTYIHGVFDGADWIRRRFEEQFGSHGDWLVDFFHLSEYLSDASKAMDLSADWLSSTMSQIKRSKPPPPLRFCENSSKRWKSPTRTLRFVELCATWKTGLNI